MFGKKKGSMRNVFATFAGLAVAVTGLSLALAAGDGASENESVNDNSVLFEELMTEGAQIFALNCAACHGAQGSESLSSHVEIIAGNSRAVSNANRMLRRIVHGGTYMPSFGATLDDRQVAAVATFVRNSWGNEYEMITEEEVAAIR